MIVSPFSLLSSFVKRVVIKITYLYKVSLTSVSVVQKSVRTSTPQSTLASVAVAQKMLRASVPQATLSSISVVMKR